MYKYCLLRQSWNFAVSTITQSQKNQNFKELNLKQDQQYWLKNIFPIDFQGNIKKFFHKVTRSQTKCMYNIANRNDYVK